MKIVGLTAPRGAGKDTAALTFGELGYRCIAFAEPIKHAVEDMFSLDAEVWTDRQLKESTLHDSGLVPGLHCSPRYLAQTLGTEWGRDLIAPDVWVRAVESKIKAEARLYGAQKFVVTDVRFSNEAEWIRSLAGRVVEIDRPGYNWNPEHASEVGPADELVDHTLLNTGSLADLRVAAMDVESRLWSG